MNQTKNRSWLATLGLSIGILEIFLLIVPIVIAILTSGLSRTVTTPLMLLLPVGLLGLIISLIANQHSKNYGLDRQKQARWGIVFNMIGSVLGILWLILLLLLMSSVFGQWI
jgi:hypothetical protein